MKIRHTFKHLEPLKSITNHAEAHVEKLEKFSLHKDPKFHFIYSVRKEDQIVEITADVGGGHFAATAKDPSLYTAIDSAIQKLQRQLMKYKDKIQYHKNVDSPRKHSA